MTSCNLKDTVAAWCHFENGKRELLSAGFPITIAVIWFNAATSLNLIILLLSVISPCNCLRKTSSFLVIVLFFNSVQLGPNLSGFLLLNEALDSPSLWDHIQQRQIETVISIGKVGLFQDYLKENVICYRLNTYNMLF